MFTTKLNVALQIAQAAHCTNKHMSEHIHVARRAMAIFVIDY